MRIGKEDLVALSIGAGVLGTGGGGNPYVGRLALRRQIELHGREPELIDAATLPDDAVVASVVMAGSPAIAIERVLSETHITAPLQHLQRYIGRRVDALIPLEVGGVNSLLPLMTACVTGLPVIDADGMGRAFPTVDKTTFGIAGVAVCPNVIVDAHEHVVVVDRVPNDDVERVSRSVIVSLGGHCGAANHVMSAARVKQVALHGTMSLALRIGRSILAARAGKVDPVQAILDESARLHGHAFGRLLFDGKIVDLRRETLNGYTVGAAVLQGLDGCEGTMRIAFQNEYLDARRDGRLAAIAPDLVAVVDRETAEPITTDTIRFGQGVKVLGIACFPPLRSKQGLKVCGPAAFGWSERYVPIEELLQGYSTRTGWEQAA